MARAELLFLLLFLSCSYGLIDPPILEVHQHNIDNAPPDEVLHENALDLEERTPTLENPRVFFYVRILTISPSVNYSINSKMHPELIWLVAEQHQRSFTEEGGDEDSCTAWRRERTYGDLEIGTVRAEYTVDGLIESQEGETVFNIANETQLLANNETYSSIMRVPFDRPWTSALLDLFTHHILGDMIDLTSYEESLAYASPYPAGSIDPKNVTRDAIRVVNPHLNVTLYARFSIPYVGTYRQQEEDEDDDCSWGDTVDEEGNYPLYDEDFASYEVQNDYMTLIPYSPHFFSFEANVTEDVPLVTSLFSNSKLYKYYSTMDGETAAFHYLNSFEVVNDSYGMQTIMAVPAEKGLLILEDPRAAENYTGQHTIVLTREGEVLRNAGQLNSIDYNYSKVYYINEFFYNLSEGEHDIGMEFYTWFGQYNASYNLTVRSDTSLRVDARHAGDGMMVATCLLSARGIPVAGQSVEMTVGNETRHAVTNGLGMGEAEFSPMASRGIVTAEFRGTAGLIPSSAMGHYYVPMESESGWGVLDDNLGLLILLSMMFAVAAFSAMNAATTSLLAGGAAFGSMFNKLFPFAKGLPRGKKMIRVKKGKEALASIAMAVLTGGASAGAGGKFIMEKLGEKAAEKGVKDKVAKEAGKKVEKKAAEKAGKGGLDKKTKARIEFEGGAAPGGEPGDDKGKKRYTPEQVKEIEKRENEKDAKERKEREKARARFRRSQDKVSPKVVGEVRDAFRNAREEKIREVERVLSERGDEGFRSESLERLRGTKIYVVEQNTWASEMERIEKDPSSTYAYYDRESNEIYVSQKRAHLDSTREKSIRHEVDHVVCNYQSTILCEGHADASAKMQMGERFHPMLVTYEYPMKTYE
ncbi:MAG: hypothetical protein ABIH29_03015, partial [Candidatus Micrarchaeota archaeon]